MKIEAVEIYGYGKWVDQTFQVDDSMQIFYGGNEAGKTTLMSFVHSVLFGFPHRQSAELRYEPKTGSRYGGKLLVQDSRYGRVTIERVKGKASGEVTVFLEDGTTGSDTLLNELLYGMDREWYQSIFSFNLDGIQHIDRMTKEKLNRYFLSAGTLGTEQFLKEADRLHTQASKLYKPTGRVPDINKKMKDVEKKGRKVEAAKKKNSQYTELVNDKQRIEQTIRDIREKLNETDRHLSQLRQMAREWSRFEELRTLQQELQRADIEMLPEDGLHQLNHFNTQLEELRTGEIHEQEKIRQYQETYRPSKMLDFYERNEDQFHAMQTELEDIRVKIVTLEQLQEDEEQMKQRLLKEKLRLGLNPIADMPGELTVEERQLISRQAKEAQQLEKQLEETQNRLSLLEYKRQSLSEEIDALENQLWTNKEYEQMEQLLNQRKAGEDSSSAAAQTKRTGSLQWMTIAGGVGLFVLSFLLPVPMNWLAIAVGIGLFIGAFSFKKRAASQEKTEPLDASTPYSYEDYIKQTEIRKNWRLKLAQSDEIEQQRREVEQEKEKYQQKKEVVSRQWNQFKEQKQIPDSWTMEETLTKEEDLSSIRDDELSLSEKRTQLNDLLSSLQTWKQTLMVFEEDIDLSSSYQDLFQQVKRIFQSVKEEEKRQQEYIARFKEANRELERLIQEIKKIETKKRRLLRAVEAETEEDFRKKYAAREDLKQKRARLELLKSQLEEWLETFEAFRSQEELSEVIQEKEQTMMQLKNEEDEQTNQKIQREVDIRKLEEGGDYAVLLQEYENAKSELQTLVDEWASLKVAAHLIEQTLNYAKKDRLPGTIADAEEYFQELTDGNYTQILLEEDTMRVRHKNHLLYDASELSRGTAEQLYVSLRLAFIKNIADTMELPLLVDDGFVNFDPERKRRMWALLEDISREAQVLYFTFDQEAMEEFQQAGVTVL